MRTAVQRHRRLVARDIVCARILEPPGEPLRLANMPRPEPNVGQVLIRIHTCAVCRPDLHIVDVELTDLKLPLVPEHLIVGTHQ
jgi:propanol-preferring alcohol dehydrogenase